MIGWLRRTWRHIDMGRCSGFPLCCITFFVLVWWSVDRERFYRGWRLRYRLLCATRHDGGYVPCPLCLISGARVSVKRCGDHCGHLSDRPKRRR